MCYLLIDSYLSIYLFIACIIQRNKHGIFTVPLFDIPEEDHCKDGQGGVENTTCLQNWTQHVVTASEESG